MEIRDFGRRFLTDAFEIKEKLKEQHYIELCDLIKKIYDHSEYEHTHTIRVEYSTYIYLASDWWYDHFSGIDYEYDMDEGEPEQIEMSDIFQLEVNLKEEYNKICNLDIMDISEVKTKLFNIASKQDRERIYFNKSWETQHETNVAMYTNSLETFYDREGITKIVRSCKLKSC
tara:strand:+ start:446 stop:964 length:519 start_codon:yes stop_codon:yes gene_type:complete